MLTVPDAVQRGYLGVRQILGSSPGTDEELRNHGQGCWNVIWLDAYTHYRSRRGAFMATFITIGYGDVAGYESTDPSVRQAAHAHDARLRASGALIGVAGTAVQVRNPDNKALQTTEGPYLRSELPIAGFAVIEAADLQEAIKLVSGTPCAVAHGVVEVWPLQSMP